MHWFKQSLQTLQALCLQSVCRGVPLQNVTNSFLCMEEGIAETFFWRLNEWQQATFLQVETEDFHLEGDEDRLRNLLIWVSVWFWGSWVCAGFKYPRLPNAHLKASNPSTYSNSF